MHNERREETKVGILETKNKTDDEQYIFESEECFVIDSFFFENFV